ncbi:MAG: hypothetical protein AAF487_11985 [Bacteroidota bacterium]
MEQSNLHIERLERQDRNEKIVVIILLVLAILTALWAFSRRDAAPITQKETQAKVLSNKDASSSDKPAVEDEIGSIGDSDQEDQSMVDDQNQSDLEEENEQESTPAENLTKEGILAVGLFQNPQNANRMKSKLSEMGFDATSRTREDGKIIVGVKSSEDDKALHAKIISHFNDAVFVINP